MMPWAYSSLILYKKVREMFFFSENFSKVFSLTEFSDDIEVVFCFKDAIEFEQILWGDVLNFLENVDLVVGKLSMQIIFLFDINDFDSHEFVGFVIFAFVDMRAIAEADLI
jgi:hypothetical protein